MSEIYLIPDENNVFHKVEEEDIFDMSNPVEALTKARNQGVTAGLDRFMNELMEYKKHIEGEFIPWNLVESTYKRLKEADNGRSNDM